MVTFLTSSFIEYQTINTYIPKPIDESNHFGDNLRKYWVENAHFLLFASDPSDAESVDHVTQEMFSAFKLANFSIGEIRYFDNRTIDYYKNTHDCSPFSAPYEALKEALEWADIFFLAGGHAPTENTFMRLCHLKSLIHNPEIFDGIFIGLSAGSLNAAADAYLIPELPGESLADDFIRFKEGLGLTTLNILPHYQYYKDVILDGKLLIDEIIAQDSYERDVYMITDGSYFMIRNGVTEFFGEGMILEKGEKRPLLPGIICPDCQRFRPASDHKYLVNLFDTLVAEAYEWVINLNSKTEKIEFFHISGFMLENGFFPVNLDNLEQLLDLFVTKLVVPEEKQPCFEQMELSVILSEIDQKGSYVRTVHLNTPDGIRSENIRIHRLPGNEDNLLFSLTDISMILDHDALTDEYSRSGFIYNAEKLLKDPEYSKGYSMVYTNVQGLKAVNDLLGIVSGDMVIFQEKDSLIRELKPVLLARLESDHFAIITKTTNLTDGNLKRFCFQTYVEGSKQLPLLLRCGIYHITDTSKKITYMLDQAKIAENSIASDQPLPYAVCNEQMSTEYVNQRVFISELDSALQNKEFQTFYQPVVDAKTGKIVSAEALIRWNHSKRGMIPPGQFIPLFEKEGLITKLDSFMIRSVIDFNLKRMKEGKYFVPCAVNLSRVDFYDTKLLNMIRHKLAGLDDIHQMLKLEVTESAYAVLESDAFTFLQEMKRLGLSILLDDFGSGMSSLSTLESFEFDVIKLDMGFIRKIGKQKNSESIIKHTIGLAHDSGATVVAEGVESKEQLEFLQSVNCDMIQGYYFYKPMPEEEFAQLLK